MTLFRCLVHGIVTSIVIHIVNSQHGHCYCQSTHMDLLQSKHSVSAISQPWSLQYPLWRSTASSKAEFSWGGSSAASYLQVDDAVTHGRKTREFESTSWTLDDQRAASIQGDRIADVNMIFPTIATSNLDA
ncbi:hypothetical protein F5887DRAFT_972153 [Amanita rubescens]|nr:hypothetical protein F5887DRAFT_972153 [Amanita rubescens]